MPYRNFFSVGTLFLISRPAQIFYSVVVPYPVYMVDCWFTLWVRNECFRNNPMNQVCFLGYIMGHISIFTMMTI